MRGCSFTYRSVHLQHWAWNLTMCKVITYWLQQTSHIRRDWQKASLDSLCLFLLFVFYADDYLNGTSTQTAHTFLCHTEVVRMSIIISSISVHCLVWFLLELDSHLKSPQVHKVWLFPGRLTICVYIIKFFIITLSLYFTPKLESKVK